MKTGWFFSGPLTTWAAFLKTLKPPSAFEGIISSLLVPLQTASAQARAAPTPDETAAKSSPLGYLRTAQKSKCGILWPCGFPDQWFVSPHYLHSPPGLSKIHVSLTQDIHSSLIHSVSQGGLTLNHGKCEGRAYDYSQASLGQAAHREGFNFLMQTKVSSFWTLMTETLHLYFLCVWYL